jgi:hypothetical protein
VSVRLQGSHGEPLDERGSQHSRLQLGNE